MRITDELRKWGYGFCGSSYEVVNAIADRIDAAYQKAIESLTTDMKPMTEENMANEGWIRIPAKEEAPSEQLAEWIEGRGLVTGPLDADGELWHRGDMSDTSWGVIEGISFSDGEWWIRGHDVTAPWIAANSARHYHEPTVEDVLREFSCVLMGKREFDGDVTKAVAEYAQKLQLRES